MGVQHPNPCIVQGSTAYPFAQDLCTWTQDLVKLTKHLVSLPLFCLKQKIQILKGITLQMFSNCFNLQIKLKNRGKATQLVYGRIRARRWTSYQWFFHWTIISSLPPNQPNAPPPTHPPHTTITTTIALDLIPKYSIKFWPQWPEFPLIHFPVRNREDVQIVCNLFWPNTNCKESWSLHRV